MMPSRPIEIIGGGLAGLSLGLALRRAGVAVTIFEAGDYPRHRVCGEFITGLSLVTIERLGLAPLLADALPHREVAWFMNEEPARIQRLPAPALGLSRFALDARIAGAFAAAGGELRTHTRLADTEPKPGRVFATGRRRGRSTWLGLKVHVRGLALTRDLELHLGTHAYVGLSRVEDGAVNVCGLFRSRSETSKRLTYSQETKPRVGDGGYAGPRLLLDSLRVSRLGALAARLSIATIEAASFCAVAGLNFDRRVPATDKICLGDACAMVPPFTGNGMAMAFQSAELALDPLLAFARGESDWATASRATNTALRRRFRLRLASADALHPFLLRPRHQRWLVTLNRARLVPFAPLYAALH